MWKSTSRRSLAIALLAAGSLAVPATVHAQRAQNNESDMAFLQRMQARLSRIEARTEQLEVYADQRMGKSTGTKSGYGVSMAGKSAGTMRDSAGGRNGMDQPVNSEATRIQLQLRSMRKKAKKESDRIADQAHDANGSGDLDREHIESVVFRTEQKLDELEKDLRRL
ncbi:MAG: hypothetical protein GQ577_02080 [Woeseiaceae bacterium]|nr:hypothetical protein [Woeseiaceae bacterium]